MSVKVSERMAGSVTRGTTYPLAVWPPDERFVTRLKRCLRLSWRARREPDAR
jgi:hypothetical protein